MSERTARRTRGWLGLLGALTLAGVYSYVLQWQQGLGITGLGREVSWGLYIGQFTFLVGVAASAVMVVLPYYLHGVRVFGPVVVFAEFLAAAAVMTAVAFVLIDMGRPDRLLNLLLHPNPGSLMFWDMLALGGYAVLNLVIAFNIVEADRNSVAPRRWVRRLAYISIPWAISIHVVTAFLFAGLPGRPYWLSSLTAARFLVSAFASGPALLVIVLLVLARFTPFSGARAAARPLVTVITYAVVLDLLFMGLEAFTALYSGIPEHVEAVEALFAVADGQPGVAPAMWVALALAAGALFVLLSRTRVSRTPWLVTACTAVFISVWLEKGVAFVVAGFSPTAFGRMVSYLPTVPEVFIVLGVWALGGLLFTFLCNLALVARREGEW